MDIVDSFTLYKETLKFITEGYDFGETKREICKALVYLYLHHKSILKKKQPKAKSANGNESTISLGSNHLLLYLDKYTSGENGYESNSDCDNNKEDSPTNTSIEDALGKHNDELEVTPQSLSNVNLKLKKLVPRRKNYQC